jgi:hypothetical protein
MQECEPFGSDSFLIVFRRCHSFSPQEHINKLLKERWLELTDEDKETYRGWTEWDKKRYAHHLSIYESRKAREQGMVEEFEKDELDAVHVPKKKRKNSADGSAIPKKMK